MAGSHDEYARFAGLYDPLVGPLIAGVRRAVTTLALERGARSAVDLCCGTGDQLIRLDRAGVRGTGVDLSAAMLGVARAKSPATVAYVRADASRTPLPAGSFDLAVIAFALHEKPRDLRGPLLDEALRLTASGGALAVADYMHPRGLGPRLGHWGARFFERAAGKEHYANYLDYVDHGALCGLLRARGLGPERITLSHLGAVGLAVVPKEHGPPPKGNGPCKNP